MPMRSSIETADAVRRGELKATEVLDECLAAIEAGNASVNAFVHLDADLLDIGTFLHRRGES